ncbi:MAG: exodeoxyribonuclease VII small subunit [Clostridia bacterium]|nr:exodeoxyribonuclease VII small subunit [Lachnospiraceae bacterium]NCC00261.1 exodeoxyribonuclease VII small subunit [Clostridia bacterium]NCD02285.1 exodeoxyribonuclease VII small subunit [Clostridia bacterium]
MAKSKTLETAFEELDDLIEQMEYKETSLEESFKLYTAGMKLIKYCNDSLDKVEKKLIEINEEE